MSTFEIILDILRQSLGPSGPAIMGLVILLFLCSLGYWALKQEQNDPLHKLETKAKSFRASHDSAANSLLRNKKKNEALEKYTSFIDTNNSEEISALKKTLFAAGYRSNDAVRWFYVIQLGLALGLLILGGGYYVTSVPAENAGPMAQIQYILAPGAMGYFIPKFLVNKKAAARKQEIQDNFPDSLDMMLVCVEAGQSLDQAIYRISRELRHSCMALAEEYTIVSHELRVGKDRSAALRDFAERADVPDITSFVTVMIQSVAFGTSMSDAISMFAGEMRQKRVMRAEEKANKLPTKMTMATMILSLPPLMIIFVAPALVGLGDLMGTG